MAKPKTLAMVAIFMLGILLAGCTEKPAEEAPAKPAVEKPAEEAPAKETAPKPKAPEPKKTIYTGTLYVAGMGGHFAKAQVEIDPTAEKPIKIVKLGRISIGTKLTHPTHDPTIDVNNRNIMYYSTYKLDGGKAHFGKVDLSTGKVLMDVLVDIPERATQTGALYCGSGQSEKHYVLATMTHEAYIDVVDKETLQVKHRLFLDKQVGQNYKFFHGINTPDLKSFVVAINLADEPHGTPNGNIKILELDMAALERGEVVVKKEAIITGEPDTTRTFRGKFTTDGKYLLQSGNDRFFLLDRNFNVVDVEIMPEGWKNHDAMPTPDNKYAVLTVRIPVGEDMLDGALLLYDIENRKLVSKEPVSTCKACHDNVGITGSAVLCGIDGNWE